MNIHFTEPLSAAWARMKKALFQPFDIGKWFTIGFTAFLAGLVDGHGGGGGGNHEYGYKKANWDELFNFPGIAMEWMADNPVWATLIFIGIGFLFVLGIVLTWLSSRGKFMFLDNVVYDKAEVSKPWYDFSKEGNSLFLWRLVYGLICLVVILLSLYAAYSFAYNMHYGYIVFPAKLFIILAMILYFMVLFIIMGYISLFLDSFVVPIMYKKRISATRAWGVFIRLFAKHLGSFIVYGLFIFVLMILVVISIIAFGFITCCIGFLLLIIPYISSVVLLPVSYTFRAYSVEFLEQFGEDYHIYPKAEVEELTVGE
jgi:hypothetical protein